MKRNRKIMSALLAMTVFATSVFATPMDAQAASMKLNKTKATIKVGESVTLKVKNKKKKVKWSSNKKSVATVTSKGKVTGKKAGTAKITAKVGTKKLNCTVTVKKKTVAKSKYENNYDKLVNYVKSYGKANAKGEKVVQDVFPYDDTNTTYTYSFVYDGKTKKVRFVCNSVHSGENAFSDALILNINPGKAPTGYGYYCLAGSNQVYEFDTNTNLSKIKSEKNMLKWNLIKGYDSDTAQKLCNLRLDYSYILWNYMLKEKTGMSLTDLGFGK